MLTPSTKDRVYPVPRGLQDHPIPKSMGYHNPFHPQLSHEAL